MKADTEAACAALLRRLLANNGWIVSHDAQSGRATIVFGAIPNDDLDVGDALASVHGLLFPNGGRPA